MTSAEAPGASCAASPTSGLSKLKPGYHRGLLRPAKPPSASEGPGPIHEAPSLLHPAGAAPT